MKKFTQEQINEAAEAAAEAFRQLKKKDLVKIYDSDEGHHLIAIAQLAGAILQVEGKKE